MTSGAKTAIVVAGIAVIVLFVLSRQPVRAGATTSTGSGSSTAGLFFQFGTAVTNLAGKIIGPSNEGSDVDGPEDEYTGPGGYDTSSFRV